MTPSELKRIEQKIDDAVDLIGGRLTAIEGKVDAALRLAGRNAGAIALVSAGAAFILARVV